MIIKELRYSLIHILEVRKLFKIKTSKDTMDYFDEIGRTRNLQPFILSKIAISLSIRSNMPLSDMDFNTDNNGLELNRQTITGEYDALYKSLIIVNEGHRIPDNEYFCKYLKAHLDRGAQMLYNEYRYSNDLVMYLASLDKGI